MESFQDEGNWEFRSEHEPTLSVMAYAVKHPDIYTILTCRYPVKELENDLIAFDLGDIEFNDFIRKCYNLELPLTQSQMKFLFRVIGGNFRYIEFFHHAFSKIPIDKIEEVLNDIKSFEAETRRLTEQVLYEMAENLIFDKLWQRAGEEEKALSQLLYHFKLPVIETAFLLQGYTSDKLKESLEHLNNLTLIQVYHDLETSLNYYFMPPLVKNLLRRINAVKDLPAQFHENAGRYHYYMLSEVSPDSISEIEAAFWQFYQAKNKKRVDERGNRLADFYYRYSFYADSLKVCQAVYELFGEGRKLWCGNIMGLIFLSTGQYDLARPFFDKALKSFDALPILTDEDKVNKGTTLNNISQIYDARGDYETALSYLQKSLKIFQEIGDKSGEAITLYNIARIYEEQGRVRQAIQLMERMVEIDRQIAHPDYESALSYLRRLQKLA